MIRMRVLVLADDIWHPARVPQAGLQPFCKLGFEFDWITSADQWSAGHMERYPLVVLAKANNVSSSDENPWMSEPVQKAFCQHVRGGHGLIVVHSGAVGYDDAEVFRDLLGGTFREHPEQCPVTIEPVSSHALAAGAKSFKIIDEHYFMDLDDQRADVFLTTTSIHGTQPGGWTRRECEGRVCVLTPGHNPEVWQHPVYQLLLHNALLWCGEAA
jgi:type 1 glutamine amidotransferase